MKMFAFSSTTALPQASFLTPLGEEVRSDWQFSAVVQPEGSPAPIYAGHNATLALMYASLAALDAQWDAFTVVPTAPLLRGQAPRPAPQTAPEDLHVVALTAAAAASSHISSLIDGRNRVTRRRQLGLKNTVIYQADQPWLGFRPEEVKRTGKQQDLSSVLLRMRPYVEEAYARLAAWDLKSFPYPVVFHPDLFTQPEWVIRCERGDLCHPFGWIDEGTRRPYPGRQRVHQVKTNDGPVTLYATAPDLDGSLEMAQRRTKGFQWADTSALVSTLHGQAKTPKPEAPVPAITCLNTSAGPQTVVLTGCETLRARWNQGQTDTLVYVQEDPRVILFTPEEARTWSVARRLPYRFAQEAWARHRSLRGMGRLLYPVPQQPGMAV
ncbi:hypothetical protein [Deinococcus hopiensis]|uniref:Uncharacterized protein n=1 Tax=Deinococcus hopiensis KR-140 TaxID=695939 RepID=A0A1W1UN71_9DEIO|nr:hypothetical protein [Deinococcus hopiensis]SMB82520.1 hypothetical protein SAMN00790413_04046 [Deinococcus hopiensis KR-140]